MTGFLSLLLAGVRHRCTPSASPRRLGSKRKGASRETVKSNGVFAPSRAERRLPFTAPNLLQRARAAGP